MRAFTVKLSDIARCPKRLMLPRHYHSDGVCCCRRKRIVSRRRP